MIEPLIELMIQLMIRAAKFGLLLIAGLAVSTAASAQRGFGHVPVSTPSARLASVRSTTQSMTA
ncbi:MAG: hypothetical protein ACRD37_09655, partial [Candidatus Acidiferrales bacterium]